MHYSTSDHTKSSAVKKIPNLASQPYHELSHPSLRSHLSSPHLRPNSATSLNSFSSSSNSTVMSSISNPLSMGSTSNVISTNPTDLSFSSLSLSESSTSNTSPVHNSNKYTYLDSDMSIANPQFDTLNYTGAGGSLVSLPAPPIAHTFSPASVNHQTISSSSSVSTIGNFENNDNAIFPQPSDPVSGSILYYTETGNDSSDNNNRSLTAAPCDTTRGSKRSVSLSPSKSKSVLLDELDDECNNLPKFPDNVNSLSMATPTSTQTNLIQLPSQKEAFVSQPKTFGAIGSDKYRYNSSVDSFGYPPTKTPSSNVIGKQVGSTIRNNGSRHDVSRSVSLSNAPRLLSSNSRHFFSSSFSALGHQHNNSSCSIDNYHQNENSRISDDIFSPHTVNNTISNTYTNTINNTISNPYTNTSTYTNTINNRNSFEYPDSYLENFNNIPNMANNSTINLTTTGMRSAVNVTATTAGPSEYTQRSEQTPDATSLESSNKNNENILGWSKVWGSSTTSVWG